MRTPQNLPLVPATSGSLINELHSSSGDYFLAHPKGVQIKAAPGSFSLGLGKVSLPSPSSPTHREPLSPRCLRFAPCFLADSCINPTSVHTGTTGSTQEHPAFQVLFKVPLKLDLWTVDLRGRFESTTPTPSPASELPLFSTPGAGGPRTYVSETVPVLITVILGDGAQPLVIV